MTWFRVNRIITKPSHEYAVLRYTPSSRFCFLNRLIKLGLSIDEDDAAADDGEDDIPDLDDADGDEESTMEQVD